MDHMESQSSQVKVRVMYRLYLTHGNTSWSWNIKRPFTPLILPADSCTTHVPHDKPQLPDLLTSRHSLSRSTMCGIMCWVASMATRSRRTERQRMQNAQLPTIAPTNDVRDPEATQSIHKRMICFLFYRLTTRTLWNLVKY